MLGEEDNDDDDESMKWNSEIYCNGSESVLKLNYIDHLA